MLKAEGSRRRQGYGGQERLKEKYSSVKIWISFHSAFSF
jgi:hypothetical protein